jgi:type I restriction enzyme S subunit
MTSFPSGWAAAPLAALASDISYGFTSKARATGGDARMLRITDIQDGVVDWKSVPFCDISAQALSSYCLQDGDLLFARTGATVGKTYLVSSVPPQVVFASYLIRVRPAKKDLSRYLSYFFGSHLYWRQISDFSAGIGQPNVNGSKLKEILVPVAPEPELQRIANKLDTVLARVDACRDRLARVGPLLKRFRQSVLAAATSGRLTEDWRSQHGSVPIDGATGLPATWSLQSVGRYAINHNGARVPISEELRRGRKGPFPYYGASGPIDTIDGYTHDGLFLLVGEDGANLLSRSKPIAFTARGKIWVNNHAHVLGCPDEASLGYLGFVINAMDLAPFVTGSAQPKLTKKSLDQLPVPAPPISERAEIVRRVETLFAYADRLEARLTQAQTAVDRLTPSLLAKAFRGELVPQDPADEPAAELLKRLAASRATAAPKARKGRKAQAA